MPGHDPGGRDGDVARARARTGGGSLSASIAASTRSRLSSGSPMPMNTMLVRRWPSATSRREAKRTWSTISATSRSRPNPSSPGGAERAADRAAGLARDAQGVPFARPGPRRVVHQDRLDERAVAEPVERLLGQPAVGVLQLGVGDGVEAEVGVERLAEGGGQRQELVGRGRSRRPRRASRDLAGAVAGLAARGEPGREGVGGEPGQAGPRVGGHGSDASAPRGRRPLRAAAGTGTLHARCPRPTEPPGAAPSWSAPSLRCSRSPCSPSPAAAASLTVRLEAGPHTGYHFTSRGVVTARKSVTLSGPRTVTANLRHRVGAGPTSGSRPARSPVGRSARSRSNYVPGSIGRVAYSPARAVTLAAGRYLGYRFTADGSLASTRYATLASSTTATTDKRAVIDGRVYAR